MGRVSPGQLTLTSRDGVWIQARDSRHPLDAAVAQLSRPQPYELSAMLLIQGRCESVDTRMKPGSLSSGVCQALGTTALMGGLGLGHGVGELIQKLWSASQLPASLIIDSPTEVILFPALKGPSRRKERDQKTQS